MPVFQALSYNKFLQGEYYGLLEKISNIAKEIEGSK